tara:strand:- start:1545 stop:2027 length:483 start_codon:yes stop_codon:yes gene_type:complete
MPAPVDDIPLQSAPPGHHALPDENEKQEKQLANELKGAQLILYFQSAVRNVGLFTSICVAALTAANAYKLHANKRGTAWGLVGLYVASTIFLAVAMFINKQLLDDYDSSFELLVDSGRAPSTVDFVSWGMLPKVVIVAQCLIALVLVRSVWKRRADITGL